MPTWPRRARGAPALRGYGYLQPTWRVYGEPVRGAGVEALVGARGRLRGRRRPCIPCTASRKLLHCSADALIPTLTSLHMVLATSFTISGAVRVGAEGERTPCDSAVSWHVRACMHQVSGVCRPCRAAASV